MDHNDDQDMYDILDYRARQVKEKDAQIELLNQQLKDKEEVISVLQQTCLRLRALVRGAPPPVAPGPNRGHAGGPLLAPPPRQHSGAVSLTPQPQSQQSGPSSSSSMTASTQIEPNHVQMHYQPSYLSSQPSTSTYNPDYSQYQQQQQSTGPSSITDHTSIRLANQIAPNVAHSSLFQAGDSAAHVMLTTPSTRGEPNRVQTHQPTYHSSQPSTSTYNPDYSQYQQQQQSTGPSTITVPSPATIFSEHASISLSHQVPQESTPPSNVASSSPVQAGAVELVKLMTPPAHFEPSNAQAYQPSSLISQLPTPAHYHDYYYQQQYSLEPPHHHQQQQHQSVPVKTPNHNMNIRELSTNAETVYLVDDTSDEDELEENSQIDASGLLAELGEAYIKGEFDYAQLVEVKMENDEEEEEDDDDGSAYDGEMIKVEFKEEEEEYDEAVDEDVNQMSMNNQIDNVSDGSMRDYIDLNGTTTNQQQSITSNQTLNPNMYLTPSNDQQQSFLNLNTYSQYEHDQPNPQFHVYTQSANPLNNPNMNSTQLMNVTSGQGSMVGQVMEGVEGGDRGDAHEDEVVTPPAAKRARTSGPTTLNSTPQVITVSVRCDQVDCGEVIPNDQLKDHFLKRHSIRSFRCLVKDCGQSFDSVPAQRQHIGQSHPSTTEWHCSKCPKHFGSYPLLSAHHNYQHLLGLFQCSFPACTFTGEYKRKVYTHYAKQHKPTLACAYPDCTVRAPNATKLKRHQWTHLGIKPYRCKWSGCVYASARKSQTMKHITRKHLTSNPPTGTQSADPKDYLEVREELLN